MRGLKERGGGKDGTEKGINENCVEKRLGGKEEEEGVATSDELVFRVVVEKVTFNTEFFDTH